MLTDKEKDLISEMVNGTPLANRKRVRVLEDKNALAELDAWKEARLKEIDYGLKVYGERRSANQMEINKLLDLKAQIIEVPVVKEPIDGLAIDPKVEPIIEEGLK